MLVYGGRWAVRCLGSSPQLVCPWANWLGKIKQCCSFSQISELLLFVCRPLSSLCACLTLAYCQSSCACPLSPPVPLQTARTLKHFCLLLFFFTHSSADKKRKLCQTSHSVCYAIRLDLFLQL